VESPGVSPIGIKVRGARTKLSQIGLDSVPSACIRPAVSDIILVLLLQLQFHQAWQIVYLLEIEREHVIRPEGTIARQGPRICSNDQSEHRVKPGIRRVCCRNEGPTL